MPRIGNKIIPSVYAGFIPILGFLFPCFRYMWGTRKQETIPEGIATPSGTFTDNPILLYEFSESLARRAGLAFNLVLDLLPRARFWTCLEVRQNRFCNPSRFRLRLFRAERQGARIGVKFENRLWPVRAVPLAALQRPVAVSPLQNQSRIHAAEYRGTSQNCVCRIYSFRFARMVNKHNVRPVSRARVRIGSIA